MEDNENEEVHPNTKDKIEIRVDKLGEDEIQVVTEPNGSHDQLKSSSSKTKSISISKGTKDIQYECILIFLVFFYQAVNLDI